MVIRKSIICTLLLAQAAVAQERFDYMLIETTQAASVQLQKAHTLLNAADNMEDSVAALTEAILAYETGLKALRAGILETTIRERAMAQDFNSRRLEVSRLIGVLSTIENNPAPLLMLHPTGPLGAARASDIVADLIPVFQTRADALRFDLETLHLLRDLQQTATAELQESLRRLQMARTQLAEAVLRRDILSVDSVIDAQALDDLLATAETLDGFTTGLVELPGPEEPIKTAEFGALDLPVSGILLRDFQEADAAGIKRPGWVLATSSSALVTSPFASSVRYVGPLLDYGTVIVLEPKPDKMLILTGLGDVYVRIGDVVEENAPLALVESGLSANEDFMSITPISSNTQSPETLYLEVREAGIPVNPSKWFLKP